MSVRPRQFDLIAFDWDGTLFDSTALITRSIQRAVQDVGGSPPSDRDASFVIGMGLMQALAHAAPDVPKERYPELGARYRHHYGLHQNDISLFDGVLPLLDDLRRATICLPWRRARAEAASTRRCGPLNCAAPLTVRARPMRPPASRIR
jgi:phosphoglycolate phosphatase-like HAD superfamily hydrolase